MQLPLRKNTQSLMINVSLYNLEMGLVLIMGMLGANFSLGGRINLKLRIRAQDVES